MADFELPSFSLGLDFDLDSQPESHLSLNRNAESAERSLSGANRSATLEDHEVDEFETLSRVPDPQVSESPRSLKRLRRGPISEPTSTAGKVTPKVQWLDADDDIEEFSEEDELLDSERKHQYSVCSSSKFPLHGHGILASQSAKQLKGSKKKEVENASAFAAARAATSELVFPKLTISPLRRFQLIDSDSDTEEADESLNRKHTPADIPSNGRHCNLSQVAAATDLKKAKGALGPPQNEDLWKEVHTVKNFHVPTPALDEVCEEYFGSLKNTNKFQNHLEGCYETSNANRSSMQQCSFNPLPPAHHYYFHENPRIRELVRARLPNFSPLGPGSNQGNMQQNACTIDYMSQFNHGEASQAAKQKENTKPSTSRGRKRGKNTNVQELSQSWVNPKSSISIPKDAGKRRVRAVGKSVSAGAAGHWYTAPDGRRVYVKNGEELTGQIAYRQYRRENGAGFKKSKKKAGFKKKTVGKQK